MILLYNFDFLGNNFIRFDGNIFDMVRGWLD